MNPKQERFAHEYVIDQNGSAAAIRAGYSKTRAKRTAYDLLNKPDVAQLVAELQAEKRDELGITAAWWIDQAKNGLEKAFRGAPKTNYKGIPVIVDGAQVMQWDAMAYAKLLELIGKAAGLFVDRAEVETSGEVVYTIRLDRDLAFEADDD